MKDSGMLKAKCFRSSQEKVKQNLHVSVEHFYAIESSVSNRKAFQVHPLIRFRYCLSNKAQG